MTDFTRNEPTWKWRRHHRLLDSVDLWSPKEICPLKIKKWAESITRVNFEVHVDYNRWVIRVCKYTQLVKVCVHASRS